MLYYLAIFAGIVFLQWFFFSQSDVPEWSYSAFIDAVQADKVAQVVITQDRIYGQLKPPPEAAKRSDAQVPLELPAAKAPWHLTQLLDWWRQLTGDMQRRQEQQQALSKLYFTVLPLQDPALLATLQAHGVDYRGRIESHRG